MSERMFTAEERKRFEEQAHRRGFKTLREYLKALLQQDAGPQNTPSELDDPFESFKRGWDDAMNGRTLSREEFRRRMLEDAD